MRRTIWTNKQNKNLLCRFYRRCLKLVFVSVSKMMAYYFNIMTSMNTFFFRRKMNDILRLMSFLFSKKDNFKPNIFHANLWFWCQDNTIKFINALNGWAPFLKCFNWSKNSKNLLNCNWFTRTAYFLSSLSSWVTFIHSVTNHQETWRQLRLQRPSLNS